VWPAVGNPPFICEQVGGIPDGATYSTGTVYVTLNAAWHNSGTMTRDIVEGWNASQMTLGAGAGELVTCWDQSMWENYTGGNVAPINTFFTDIYTNLFGGTSCAPTNTPTSTPTNTITPTPTNTATSTATNTPISTFTPTNTPTVNTPTITNTPTSTYTSTPTPTATPNLYVWPNPFNPSTAVNGVLQAGYVAPTATMSIYTITGELVVSYCQNCPPTDIYYDPATGTINWTGRNSKNYMVSTGVYFYVIQSGGKTLLSGKILVITGK
jgi:hypothetical protein